MPKAALPALVRVDVAPTTAKTDNVVRFADTDDAARFAIALGVQLGGTAEERADTAASHMSRSQRHMLAAGVLLMSVKAECEHGHFTQLIESRGFEARSVRRAMQYAEFVLSRPEHERDRLIGAQVHTVLALAGADPEVIDAVLNDPDASIDTLSVRAMRDRIRELESGTTDLQVKLETSEAKAEGLRKRLDRSDRADAVPATFAALRAEIAAHTRKAELAIDALRAIGVELEPLLRGKGGAWADATLRMSASALAALGVQAEGALRSQAELIGGDPSPVALSYMTQQEVVEVAQRWREIVAADGHEKALRAWEREQQQPRGAGRPRAKPGKGAKP